MVDLPKVPRRLVTVEEPRSGLSARDIAAPYASLSQAFGDTSEALTAAAEANVADAAAKAVTVSADGQINVQRAAIPMVGPVGRKYQSLVAHGAVVEADTLADRDLIELRQQSRGDPNAFRSAAEAYRDDRVASMTATVGPAAAQALKRQMDNRITQSYGGLVTEHQNKAIARANEAIDARIVTLSDEMETLARRGGATGDEFEQRRENVKALLDQKVNNPLLAYPREKADAFLDTLNTRVQGAAIHEQMERVYRERGFEAARTYLKESARGLEGKVKQIDKIERAGLAWLRSEEAGFRGERDAVSREWSALKGQNPPPSQEQMLDIERRATEIGATRVATDIMVTRAARETVATIRALPVQDQIAAARSGGPQVDRAIDDAAARHGVDPQALRLFARIESGFDPLARKGSYSGLFQLSQAEFQRYGGGDILNANDNANAAAAKLKAESQAFQAKYGRAPEAWELYLTHQQGEGGFAAHQANPTGAAWQNMASTREGRERGEQWAKAAIWGNIPDRDKARFGSVENVTSQDFMDLWKSRAQGGTVASESAQARVGAVARGLLIQEMRRELPAKLDALSDNMRRGQTPNADDVLQVAQLAGFVGNDQQRRKAAELIAAAELGEQFNALTAPQRDAAISAMEERLRQGGSQVESDIVQTLRTQDKAISDHYKRDPYDAYSKYGRGEMATPTPAIDFQEPVVAGAIVQGRVAQQAVIRDQEGIGPFSVFRPTEAEAFRGTMASGNAQAVTAALSTLNGLSPDVLAATLANPAVKSGITAAIHTTDAGKMNAVMSQLDVWYKQDPQAFNARFGDQAWNALKTWQSNFRYMTPEEFAKAQTRAQDPAAQEVRKKNVDKGEEQARAMTPEQVVGAWAPFLSLQSLGINAPAVPTDPQVRDMMMGDFQRVYGQRFADTLDKDQALTQAAERVGLKWRPSRLNNNEVMLRPPETVYPEVRGSHDWMAPQIEAAIAERMGPRRDPMAVGATTPIAQGQIPRGGANWDYRIVSDATTEQQAQRYDRRLPAGEGNTAPSYQVIVRDNRRQNAKWEPLPQRFAFDPNTPQEAVRFRFGSVVEAEAGGGGGGGGF